MLSTFRAAELLLQAQQAAAAAAAAKEAAEECLAQAVSSLEEVECLELGTMLPEDVEKLSNFVELLLLEVQLCVSDGAEACAAGCVTTLSLTVLPLSTLFYVRLS